MMLLFTSTLNYKEGNSHRFKDNIFPEALS